MLEKPLHNAVMQLHADMVKFLLERGANVNASNNFGSTCLHHAVLKDHAVIIKLLLDHGANVNALDTFLRTPLHLAALEPRVDIVKLLLENGANVNVFDNSHRTPLHLVALAPHADIVKLVLDHGANVNALDNLFQTPLHNAALLSAASVVKLLLEYGANVNALCNVCQTPLHRAALNPHEDIIKLLLQHGANVNVSDVLGRTPMQCAAEKPHAHIVKFLLSYGTNVNTSDIGGRTPLHSAALTPYANIVKLYLEHGADANAVDHFNRTPLHLTVLDRQVDIAKLLLEHGSNINVLSESRQTPLGQSLNVNKPNIFVIQTLMKYGANINAVDKFGMNVLFVAVQNTSTPYEIIKLLLENGAIPDFNAETNILVSVAQPSRYHLAELLIQYIILRKSEKQGMFQILDQFKTISIKHFAEDSDNYKHILRIAHLCINEVEKMRNDFIGDEKTLFQFVSMSCLRATTYDQNVTSHDLDALLFLLRNGKYVHCKDLIYASIKRSVLIDRLCELEVNYHVTDSDIFSLNYDCIDNLIKYMSKEDIISMIFVFYDKFNDYECPGTRTSNRSTEQHEENICKRKVF